MAAIALTSTSSSIQTGTVPAGWNSNSNTVHGIGPGGDGSGRQSASIGGVGGGGGSYGRRANVRLVAGETYYYFLPAGGSGLDAWFNDLNLLLQSNSMDQFPAWDDDGGVGSVTGGETAPDGTSTAWKFMEDGTFGSHRYFTQFTKPNQTLQMSWVAYAKKVSDRLLRFIVYDYGSEWIEISIDLSTLTATLEASNGTAFTYSSLTASTDDVATGSAGNGYYRLHLKFTADAAVDDIKLIYALQHPVDGDDYQGDGASHVMLWHNQLYYGWGSKPRAPSTTERLYSVLAKAGTNATISVAGVGQSGSQGDVTYQGGNGVKPASGASGGGGGGAAGPSGAGGNASTTTGGSANNGTTAGAAGNNNGVAGTEFGSGPSYGSGSGAGGRSSSGNGMAGGNYGGAGSGSFTGAAETGGAGAGSIIYISYNPASPVWSPFQQIQHIMVR
jgi:hypothetical protein